MTVAELREELINLPERYNESEVIVERCSGNETISGVFIDYRDSVILETE